MPELTGANPIEDWRKHVDHDWTWPNSYGVVGCVDCVVVFMPPFGDDAWDTSHATFTQWAVA